MRSVLTILFVAAFSVGTLSQTEFDQPWRNPSRAIVIDPYEGNAIDWDRLAGDKRVAGIIHRATIGFRTDGQYLERKLKAKTSGYKWGSYHLGIAGDPIGQADYYLRNAAPADDETMALDIEGLDSRKDMSLADAILFIDRVHAKTGRYPILYGNHLVISEISRVYASNSAFARVPLWYARFKGSINDLPKTTWNTYSLWQFSSEINCTASDRKRCLYTVPGTSHDMDVNVFNGTVAEMRSRWPL